MNITPYNKIQESTRVPSCPHTLMRLRAISAWNKVEWERTSHTYTVTPISKFRHYFNIAAASIRNLWTYKKPIPAEVVARRSHRFHVAKFGKME